ncbi:MAG: HAMP domain-containing histidine kinase [Betaproteobacteria bacterium]|nr:MAG: HAMP domain-containing histidine kinase [Betaproteobacteria bacterium]
MRRLYLRIYLAVLASLAAFALAAGLLWRAFGEDGPWSQAYEVAAKLAQNALPPAGAPRTEQQAALEKLAANLRADVALFAPDRSPLAAVGAPLPAPEAGRERGGWIHRWGGPAWAVRLPDGRWLAARAPRGHAHAPYGLFLVLALLALAVGVGAYPVVRRLTSRLERLQAGVESLGAGELSARVRVEGHDEVAQLAESFNRAAGRIEELVGAHKSLLANASHELRTPLARIRMAVELMKESAEPKRKAELEQDIAELDALIDEILLASRLDALKKLETDERVDLLALAAEECARYDDTQLDGEPLTVRGDPRLLRRMIRNLLENAKRHGAPPIEVRVSRVGNGAELAVCDRGPGVPEAECDRVFEPFYRIGARQGAGLGLALVRQIARRHGGEARCAPQSGRGTCFIVVLPERSRQGDHTSSREPQ